MKKRTFLAILAALPMTTHSAEPERLANARRDSLPRLKERFAAAKVRYPADEIFLRVMKREARLELWARSGAGEFTRIHTYAVLCSSGGPGPKRREGDGQVPEGFYTVDRFNPASSFHLSLGLDYPNASDRIRSDRERPGFDIFIHGKAVSIGCVPVGDAAIEEIYLAALDSRARPVRVHIFPADMAAPGWPAWRDAHAELAPFWAELQPAWSAFEKTHIPPRIEVQPDGRYRVR